MGDKALKIYIAGASADLERARSAMAWARSHERLNLAMDWIAAVEAERFAGNTDASLSRSEKERYARQDLGAVAESDIFWLLSPSEGVHTVGAWVELGAALVTGRMRQALGLSHTLVLISGITSTQLLFNALADQIFEQDLEAIKYLTLRLARP